jgi:hypothetical protein
MSKREITKNNAKKNAAAEKEETTTIARVDEPIMDAKRRWKISNSRMDLHVPSRVTGRTMDMTDKKEKERWNSNTVHIEIAALLLYWVQSWTSWTRNGVISDFVPVYSPGRRRKKKKARATMSAMAMTMTETAADASATKEDVADDSYR